MAFARNDRDNHPMSDLNTTPLIDVMLVLLIMFIITIPAQTHKVAIDLPTGAVEPTFETSSVRNRITVDATDTIYWNDKPVSRLGLRKLLAQTMRYPVEPALDLQPAAEARYETVDGVMADIKRAGVTRLGLPGNQAYEQAF